MNKYFVDKTFYEITNDIYIVYSVDKSMKDKVLYPDDPVSVETLVSGFTDAAMVADYLEAKDPRGRLYRVMCREVFPSAYHYWKKAAELEDAQDEVDD